jgi:hypothetical protein
MRAQLPKRDNKSLAMCPVIHNISGQLIMSDVMRLQYLTGSGAVCQRKNFGNTRCLYSSVGNILFCPGKLDMVFKGVRNIPAMCNLLRRSTGGSLLEIRVSMLVMTVNLHKEFSVCEHCPLQQKLTRICGASAIYMLPRTEEESNALMFRIDRWESILCDYDVKLVESLNTLTSIVSVSRLGNCTLRLSSPVKGTLANWMHVQQKVHVAFEGLGWFLVNLQL